ncbi:MAG: hypothetical protein D8M59_03480 [Planctomycetes bacterium]|nr:hypothetical protein [Planctomycetota bacterium]NOG53058.1 hypothetical protein [Planctomycetota bacterium]
MRTHKAAFWGICGVLGSALFASGVALGQYETDFEGIVATPDGTLLTGQDGYYLPSGVDFFAYTYAGNVLGVPNNPEGSAQFVAGVGPGDGTNYARAQRDMTWGTGIWEVTYDTCGMYLGSGTTNNNVGSFSVQPYPGSQSYIHLLSWVDINNPVNWNAFYLAYNADGSAHTQPGKSPGTEWEGLETFHWYRFGTVLDFDTNKIAYVWVTDLNTGVSGGYAPLDWYLEGGEVGGTPTPTGFRFFGGGGTNSNNGTAWDNYGAVSADFLCTLEGDCPGPATLHVYGATPGGRVAIVAGTKPGPFTNPSSPCAGITIDISPSFLPNFPMIVNADATGHVILNGKLTSKLCGKLLVQAVDLTTCQTSSLVKK